MAACFYNREPVRRSQFAQHPVHVVLHRLLGKVQAAGHFLISETLLYQSRQLLFPATETKAVLEMQTWKHRSALSHPVE